VDNLTFLDTGSEQILAYWKHSDDEDLVIVVNLDPHGAHDTLVHLPLADLALPADQPFVVEDLLGHERYTWQGFGNYVRLDPTQRGGHVFRLIRPGT
jgi:starch synthase (maltosyl-transferring)